MIANHTWKLEKRVFKNSSDDAKYHSEDQLYFKIKKQEFEAWNQCLPLMKKTLSDTINHIKVVTHGSSFETTTLVELRELWRQLIEANKANQQLAKDERYNYFDEKSIILNMMDAINAWYSKSNYCVWGHVTYSTEQLHRNPQTRLAIKFELKTSTNKQDIKDW
jgi:hypothetical protein